MRKLLLGAMLILGLSACASSVEAPLTAVENFNGQWKIIKINEQTLSKESRASLAFNAKTMHLSGFDGCNRVMGTIKEENEMLTTKLASTKMGCFGPENSMSSKAIEQTFSLGATVKTIAENQLELSSKAGTLTLQKISKP